MTVRFAVAAAVLAILAVNSRAAGPGPGGPIFEDAASAAGLEFVHVNGATGQFYMPELLGSGAALFDFDTDGDLDVFLVQGGPLGPGGRREGPAHRLFRNELAGPGGKQGVLRFTDVTAASGAGLKAYGMGAATGDYDNDGDLDLYVTALGSNTLLRNEGDGTFTDVTAEAGVDEPRWSTSAAFFDYDRDGDLDLFVANYLDFTVENNRQCFDPTGARDYCSPKSYRPVPDTLFRNEGNGRFTDVTTASGIARAYGNGLGVSTGDYNGDGWLDLYVANDATPNQLWLNQRDGTFVDDGPLSGAALNAAGNPEGSMGIASGDYDADGDEDLFVTNIIGETFVLYVNDGTGGFEDARVKAGLGQPTAAYTGFGTGWFDVDNDGLLDLFVANGAVNTLERLRGEPVPYHMPNLLFRNVGNGRFADISEEGGPALRQRDVSRGAAFGDIDNDGDTDILVTTNNGPVRLLLNTRGSRAGSLQIRLQQPGGNRHAFGARVGVTIPGRPTLWRRVRTDGSYLVASDPRVHVGLGQHTGPVKVRVQWPDGAAETFAVSGRDRAVTLKRQ